MKRIFTAIFCMTVALCGFAQERQEIQITSFENLDEAWSYSGSDITQSVVDFSPIPPDDVQAQDGENALVVEYSGSGEGYNWAQLDFATGAMDLSGMREIHMWVYFSEDWVGQTDIRLDLPNGVGLGIQGTDVKGEWVELVWGIDRFTSDAITEVTHFGGFIAPGDATANGVLYIDNIFAVRPANLPEVETVQVYGFNELDPETGFVDGWQDADGVGLLGDGAVEPSEGDNYMEIALGDGWTNNVQAAAPLSDFDRWPDVVDIQIDARVSEGFTGTWVQYVLVVQVGADEVEAIYDQLPEQSFENAVDEWKTLTWQVDMTQHQPAFEGENTWMNLVLITNNDGAQSGELVYVDNFRVGAIVEETDVADWNLF